MEEMINKKLLKKLRKEHSWSQDQLASISGLSLRTIQRIENEGSCSLESKKSLAAAFNINVRDLNPAVVAKPGHKRGGVFGYIGAATGLLCAYSGITFSLLNGYISYGEAGFHYGVTGAFCGICCGVIGVISNRQVASVA